MELWFASLRIRYGLIALVVIVLLGVYFGYWREVRSIAIAGDTITASGSNFSDDIYLRSKKKIRNITVQYGFDGEITNKIPYQSGYTNFLQTNRLSKSYDCNISRYCAWHENNFINLRDVRDGLFLYKKVTSRPTDLQNNTNTASIENPSMNSTEMGNTYNQGYMLPWDNTGSTWESLVGDTTPMGGMPSDTMPSRGPPDMRSMGNTGPIVNSVTDPTKDPRAQWPDCKKEENTFLYGCYKTPELHLSVKGVRVDYTIVFEDQTYETGALYTPLAQTFETTFAWER